LALPHDAEVRNVDKADNGDVRWCGNSHVPNFTQSRDLQRAVQRPLSGAEQKCGCYVSRGPSRSWGSSFQAASVCECWRHLFVAALIGLWLVDTKMRLIFINPASIPER